MTCEEQLRRQREWFIYWLLRAYQSAHREGWEPSPSVDETMNRIHDVLCNEGYDPAKLPATELLTRLPSELIRWE